MSQLRRRIRNLARPASGGIGFAAARDATPARQLLVVADVAAADPVAAVAAGADVLLATAERVAAAVSAAGDRPVGARLDAATADAVRAAAAAGADFFVFDDAKTPATALLPAPGSDREPDLGRVLRLEPGANEERLRSLAPLGLDALLVGDAGDAMTVRDQLALRRAAELASAPLMIVSPAAPAGTTLQVWRDAGARLVAVPGDAATVRAAVAAVGDVPPPRRPRDDRASPLVPSIAGHQHDDDIEDPL